MARCFPILDTQQDIEQRVCFLIITKNVSELRYRLEQGLDPNSKIEGTPLLQIASEFSFATLSTEHRQIVQLLLEFGANPLETNANGKSAVGLLLETEEKHTPIFLRYQQTVKKKRLVI